MAFKNLRLSFPPKNNILTQKLSPLKIHKDKIIGIECIVFLGVFVNYCRFFIFGVDLRFFNTKIEISNEIFLKVS